MTLIKTINTSLRNTILNLNYQHEDRVDDNLAEIVGTGDQGEQGTLGDTMPTFRLLFQLREDQMCSEIKVLQILQVKTGLDVVTGQQMKE